MTQGPQDHERRVKALEALASAGAAGDDAAQQPAAPPPAAAQDATDSADASLAAVIDVPYCGEDIPAVGAEELRRVAQAAGAAGVNSPAAIAQRTARAQLAHAHNFKKTMVPLLLVAGVLLILLASAVILLNGLDSSPASASASMFDASTRKVLVLLAYPLSAILLMGAWMFHRDVTRATRQDSAERPKAG